MATLMHRIKLTNDRPTFVTLWLEPWGEDYGMSPGDEFEVVAEDSQEGFRFHVVSEENNMKLYAEGDVRRVAVSQNGVGLSCGHSRLQETW